MNSSGRGEGGRICSFYQDGKEGRICEGKDSLGMKLKKSKSKNIFFNKFLATFVKGFGKVKFDKHSRIFGNFQ